MQDTTNGTGGLAELEERAERLERRLARMRGELGEAERAADSDTRPGIGSPNRKPPPTFPTQGGQEPADTRGRGAGGRAKITRSARR